MHSICKGGYSKPLECHISINFEETHCIFWTIIVDSRAFPIPMCVLGSVCTKCTYRCEKVNIECYTSLFHGYCHDKLFVDDMTYETSYFNCYIVHTTNNKKKQNNKCWKLVRRGISFLFAVNHIIMSSKVAYFTSVTVNMKWCNFFLVLKMLVELVFYCVKPICANFKLLYQFPIHLRLHYWITRKVVLCWI